MRLQRIVARSRVRKILCNLDDMDVSASTNLSSTTNTNTDSRSTGTAANTAGTIDSTTIRGNGSTRRKARDPLTTTTTSLLSPVTAATSSVVDDDMTDELSDTTAMHYVFALLALLIRLTSSPACIPSMYRTGTHTWKRCKENLRWYVTRIHRQPGQLGHSQSSSLLPSALGRDNTTPITPHPPCPSSELKNVDVGIRSSSISWYIPSTEPSMPEDGLQRIQHMSNTLNSLDDYGLADIDPNLAGSGGDEDNYEDSTALMNTNGSLIFTSHMYSQVITCEVYKHATTALITALTAIRDDNTTVSTRSSSSSSPSPPADSSISPSPSSSAPFTPTPLSPTTTAVCTSAEQAMAFGEQFLRESTAVTCNLIYGLAAPGATLSVPTATTCSSMLGYTAITLAKLAEKLRTGIEATITSSHSPTSSTSSSTSSTSPSSTMPSYPTVDFTTQNALNLLSSLSNEKFLVSLPFLARLLRMVTMMATRVLRSIHLFTHPLRLATSSILVSELIGDKSYLPLLLQGVNDIAWCSKHAGLSASVNSIITQSSHLQSLFTDDTNDLNNALQSVIPRLRPVEILVDDLVKDVRGRLISKLISQGVTIDPLIAENDFGLYRYGSCSISQALLRAIVSKVCLDLDNDAKAKTLHEQRSEEKKQSSQSDNSSSSSSSPIPLSSNDDSKHSSSETIPYLPDFPLEPPFVYEEGSSKSEYFLASLWSQVALSQLGPITLSTVARGIYEKGLLSPDDQHDFDDDDNQGDGDGGSKDVESRV